MGNPNSKRARRRRRGKAIANAKWAFFPAFKEALLKGEMLDDHTIKITLDPPMVDGDTLEISGIKWSLP